MFQGKFPCTAVSNVAAAIHLKKEGEKKMDPPTEIRAQRLYDQIMADLKTVKEIDETAREAVLLRISDQVGELAEIAEGAEEKVPVNGGSVQKAAMKTWLMHISLELLKILSGTDFYYFLKRSDRAYAGSGPPLPRESSETNPARRWPLAA